MYSRDNGGQLEGLLCACHCCGRGVFVFDLRWCLVETLPNLESAVAEDSHKPKMAGAGAVQRRVLPIMLNE